VNRARVAFLTAAILVIALAGQAIAATRWSDTRANDPQVASVATSNATARFPTNKQNEPTIAIAHDGWHAIAGSNDEQKQPACGTGTQRGSVPGSDCSFFPGVGTSGVYTSSNGGSTWMNRGLLPGYTDTGTSVAATAHALPTSAAPGTLVSDGDPVIVYGPKPTGAGGFSFAQGGRAYYANLASYASGAAKGNQAPELLAVSISDNNGASWYDPVVAVSSNGYTFNDKEAIWADRTDGSPYFGRVYLSWTQFRGIPGCAEPVMFAWSGDGGLTWSKPNQLSAARNCGHGGRQGSAIRSGADGSVLVFWEDTDKLGSLQVVQISNDGGQSFSKTITVGRVTDIQDPIPGANFRTDSFLSAAVAPSGAVYAAWATRTADGGRIVVAKSTTGGESWSSTTTVSGSEGYAFFQGLDVAPNGRVDVGYQALTTTNSSTYGMGNATVHSYYVSLPDGGATWSSPTRVTTEGSDPAVSAQNNLARQFWGDYNTLVSASGFALFIYTDTRSGVGCAAVDAYQHALDAGTAATKPAPPAVCGSQFGNSDVFVSKVTP